MGGKHRPSDDRRAALKQSEIDKIPNISNLTPIQRYYSSSLKLLKRFYTAVNKNNLDEAYIFGLRFAQFSTKVLPTHDYYKVEQKEYVKLRKDNQNDLEKLIGALENVVNLMDLEELEKQETKRREEEAMRLIQEREEQMRKEEEERCATQALLDRLNILDKLGSVPSGTKSRPTKTMNEDLEDFEEEEAHLPIDDLPAPIPYHQIVQSQEQDQPPPPYGSISHSVNAHSPPSYDTLMHSATNFSENGTHSIRNLYQSSSRSLSSIVNIQDSDIEKTTFINPLGPLVPASLVDHGEVKNKLPPLPFSTQKSVIRSKYYNSIGRHMIEVFHLETYQGRSASRDSTNGCTVISPLVAVHHLHSEGGIADMKIEEIIDEIAPVILSKVRGKLGLSGHALIIPSDVHDYMVDEHILRQEMFVGVCGGSLLDCEHVCEFLDLLENGKEEQESSDVQKEKKDSSKKVAAALFFHEHVVSILKVVLPDGSMWYDLVDSMPTRIAKNGKTKMGATRTRCKDRESLEVLLSMYACEKFSPADVQYIDDNEWDDTMCDFDPRVFQGFVWKENE